MISAERVGRVEAKTFALLTVGIPLVCYLLGSIVYFVHLGRYGMALTFFGYSVANVGLILDLYSK